MIIRYKFRDGTVSEVSVPENEKWVQAIVDMEDEERRHNRRETGRHIQLSVFTYEDSDYFSDDTDTLADFVEKEMKTERHNSLKKAIGELKPEQRRLLVQIYVEKRKAVDIAREEKVTEAAISQRLKKIYEKIKKSLI